MQGARAAVEARVLEQVGRWRQLLAASAFHRGGAATPARSAGGAGIHADADGVWGLIDHIEFYAQSLGEVELGVLRANRAGGDTREPVAGYPSRAGAAARADAVVDREPLRAAEVAAARLTARGAGRGGPVRGHSAAGQSERCRPQAVAVPEVPLLNLAG